MGSTPAFRTDARFWDRSQVRPRAVPRGVAMSPSPHSGDTDFGVGVGGSRSRFPAEFPRSEGSGAGQVCPHPPLWGQPGAALVGSRPLGLSLLSPPGGGGLEWGGLWNSGGTLELGRGRSGM